VTRTLVVGDVHGCAAELAELLATVRPDDIVLVGDLYTRGPDPVGVARIVMQPNVRVVRGNHDQYLLDALDQPAGARGPFVAETIDALDAAAPGWRDHLAATPLQLRVGRFVVVHAGLPPDGDASALPLRVFLNLRRVPDGAVDAPRWTDVYRGDTPVLYGHDARRGLYVAARDGRPFLVGLDTGCVYGRQLSGYIVEEDRVVSVSAHRRWFVPAVKG
jgi:diadenosine tetraphosphatase ApaH/serine/threonine PP2A family protein phosphatase